MKAIKALALTLSVAIVALMGSCSKKETPKAETEFAEAFAPVNNAIDWSKPVVVDFGATWCVPCQHYHPVFDAVAEANADKATFIYVDVDEQPELAAKFDISSIPATVVINPDGSYDMNVGGMDEAELTAYLAPYIK